MMALKRLAKKIRGCTKCELHKTRTNAVFGRGSIDAKILLLGEAPGASEDLVGESFVGAAGKFLDQLIKDAGLVGEEIFITNIVRCRPIYFDGLRYDICITCKKCEECHPSIFRKEVS